jgi:hypothetical protein
MKSKKNNAATPPIALAPLTVGAFWSIPVVAGLELFVTQMSGVKIGWPISVTLATFAVASMEVAGVLGQDSWLRQMDAQLGTLAEQREVACTQIEQLKVAMQRPDSGMDRLVSGLKGAANIPLAVGKFGLLTGGHILIGMAKGALGGRADIPLKIEAGVSAVHAAHEMGHSSGGVLDTRLPSQRAATALALIEASLRELDKAVERRLASRARRLKWRKNVIADGLLWAICGSIAATIVAGYAA